MYLSNKQIIQLLTPFLLGIILLFFQDEILTFMHSKFPTFKSISNKDFHKNVDEYLRIDQEMHTYNDVVKNVKERKNSLKWITSNVLYQKQLTQSEKKANISEHKQLWNLEAVFPKYDMAIINSQFVHKGSIINKAKIIQIKFDSVLLKTNKGLKWVHLFH
ncbi:hypothetical protein [Sulfurimonas autotrophica]|uniref:Uncharacterized protein n=1 Tax=Sulfurimonas autotrophica (strain ATCC BAA-671 / DSM 16294 / JCM 11897 / OK10) TaxID=563040 RepID=E0UP36_SULAO|nr:hypothetical protein [Sulfurimonas autotrophica]ADN08069.1 hypothetical protein Saut_0020 [Sulfurimonas autotrophica DSM 16294]